MKNSKCGKWGPYLSIDFGDAGTQPRMIETEQGSTNQNVNIEDKAFLFTSTRDLSHIKKRKEKKKELFFKKEKHEILTFPHLPGYDIFR